MAFIVFGIAPTPASAKHSPSARRQTKRMSAWLWAATIVFAGACFVTLINHPVEQQHLRTSEAAL